MSLQDPGLDLTALRAVRARRQSDDTPLLLERIEQHLAEHAGYVSFSGGKDSLAVLHLARQVDPAVPVAFFDSGIEYPETYQYLSRLTHDWDLNLHIYRADPPILDVLAHSGFWDLQRPVHQVPDLFEVMVAAPAQAAHDDHGPGVLWGVRSAESRGRQITYARALAGAPEHLTREQARLQHGGRIDRADGTTVYGPIWDWSTSQVWSYLAGRDLPVNPVYDKLRAAGAPPESQRLTAMLDAVAVDRGRLVWLQRGWPELFNTLATVLPRMRDHT